MLRKGRAKVALALMMLALAACGKSTLAPAATPTTPTPKASSTPIASSGPLSIYFALRDQTTVDAPPSPPYHLFALNASDGKVRWKRPGSNPTALTPGEISPYLAQGVLFIGDLGVSAVNASTGHQLWHHQASGTNRVNNVINGVVYATEIDGFDGELYALDASTGKLLWRSATLPDLRHSVISVTGNLIYAASLDTPSSLTAYSTTNGAQLWRYPAEGDNLFQLQQADNDQTYAVTSTINLQGLQGFLAVINNRTGKLHWRFPKTGLDDVTLEGLSQGLVYVSSSNDQSLYALNASDGSVKWKAPVGMVASASLDSDIWYIGTSDGTVYALNAQDGSVKWQMSAIAQGDFDTRVMGVSQGLLYVSHTQQGVYALNVKDGSIKWHSAKGALSQGIAFTMLGASDGVVYIDIFNNNVANSDTLAALRATNGSPLWSYHVEGMATESGFTFG